MYCPESSAFVYWQNPDQDQYSYLCMYSPDMRKSYQASFDKDCPYFEWSEIIELYEGAVVWMENNSAGVRLAGSADDIDSLQTYEPQNLTDTVNLNDEDEMTAGKDFEAGVYDIVLDSTNVKNDYASAFLKIDDEENRYSYFVNVDERNMVYYHFPFRDGFHVTVNEYGDGMGLSLVPSY